MQAQVTAKFWKVLQTLSAKLAHERWPIMMDSGYTRSKLEMTSSTALSDQATTSYNRHLTGADVRLLSVEALLCMFYNYVVIHGYHDQWQPSQRVHMSGTGMPSPRC